MKVVWSKRANEQITKIAEMVAEYAGEASAIHYIGEFNRLVDLASVNPLMGKIGIVTNTRELYPINGKYRIVYRVSDDILRVLSVKSVKQLHTEKNKS